MREQHVDFVKGWAMIAIVYFHISTGLIFWDGDFPDFIGRGWHVPIFFIVAGFYVKDDRLRKPIPFLKRKFQTLYVPATIVYVLAILLHNIFVNIGWYPIGAIHPGNGNPFHYYEIKDFAICILKALLCAGSGELVMGAMWFLYVLLYAFVGLSLLSFGLKVIVKDEKRLMYIRLALLFALASISCYLSNIVGFTINRLSQFFIAMLLIEIGRVINQKFKWEYTSNYAFIGCILLFLHIIYMLDPTPSLAKNKCSDLLSLIVGGLCAIYIWAFLYFKLRETIFARCVCYVGRESLYVMMFHILGLFICNSFFEYVGYFSDNSPKGMYTYDLNSNPLLIICYLVMGVGFPLLVVCFYRSLKSYILEMYKQE